MDVKQGTFALIDIGKSNDDSDWFMTLNSHARLCSRRTRKARSMLSPMMIRDACHPRATEILGLLTGQMPLAPFRHTHALRKL